MTPILCEPEPTTGTTGFISHSPIMPIKILAVISAPRFGPTDCFHAISTCLIEYGVHINKVGGANWGQNLERAIDEAVEAGADWVLTWDFDTILQPWQFEKLITLIGEHQDYDAFAPLEVRRECGQVLASFPQFATKEEMARGMTENDVLPATTAHFGCTLIRADALRRMPKPWLHHKPAPDGGWGPGRVDDDIGFWHKFKEAGNRLGIATRVCIGHSQIMATWLLDDFRVVHQHMNDYHKNGPPPNVWR